MKTPTQGDRHQTNVGVYVLGMHRSGTSLATRLINLLGVPICTSSDLLGKARGNPTGLWESRTLVKLNDALLKELQSTWWCPPRSIPFWVQHPTIERRSELARCVFESVYPTLQWVWKDPRNCITLPFWLRSLQAKAVAVLMIRHPLDIAASLNMRDNFNPAVSIALWERYFQHLIPALQGIPTIVTSYEAIMRDSVAWCEGVQEFLSSQSVVLDESWNRDAIRAFVVPSLRHHADTPEMRHNAVSDGQREMYDRLLKVTGHYATFNIQAPIETPRTDKIFNHLRHAYRLSSRKAIWSLAHAGTAPRSRTALRENPLLTVVISNQNQSAALRCAVRRFLRTSPAQTELIIVDYASTDSCLSQLAGDSRHCKVVRSPSKLGIAGARNLGAIEAKGEIIVIADAEVLPQKGWFKPLFRELANPMVGAVGPSLKAMKNRNITVYGLTFTDEALNVAWLPCYAATPYVVPLLPGCFLGIRRDVFHRIGGFDPGMIGYGVEDIEFCLRLWRLGFECRIVPSSQVRYYFQKHGRPQFNWELFLANLVRLSLLHLTSANLTRFIDNLRGQPAFDRAMARVFADGAFQRRSELRTLYKFDDDWFFKRFDTNIFSDVSNVDTGTERLFSSRSPRRTTYGVSKSQ